MNCLIEELEFFMGDCGTEARACTRKGDTVSALRDSAGSISHPFSISGDIPVIVGSLCDGICASSCISRPPIYMI